jgi:hypothetical protein
LQPNPQRSRVSHHFTPETPIFDFSVFIDILSRPEGEVGRSRGYLAAVFVGSGARRDRLIAV